VDNALVKMNSQQPPKSSTRSLQNVGALVSVPFASEVFFIVLGTYSVWLLQKRFCFCFSNMRKRLWSRSRSVKFKFKSAALRGIIFALGTTAASCAWPIVSQAKRLPIRLQVALANICNVASLFDLKG